MSADYEAWMKAGFAAFNRRDWDAIARGLPDDFEFHDKVPPDALVMRGPYAMRDVTEANGDLAFAGLVMEVAALETIELDGDRTQILVRVRTSAAGGHSETPVSAELGQLWTLVDGAPIRAEQFRSWAEAHAAAQAAGFD
jgi:hypothetical protein